MNSDSAPKNESITSSHRDVNLYCFGFPGNSIEIQDSNSSSSSSDNNKIQTKHQTMAVENECDPKKKRMQAILQRLQDVQDQSQREKEEILKNPVVKRTSVQDRIEYDQLKKQFQSNKYFPLQALRQAKKDIDWYSKHCKMETTNPEQLIIIGIRFQQRKKFFRSIRLAVEEVRIKVKQQDRDSFQKYILSDAADLHVCLSYISNKMEDIFFKKLYHQTSEKKKGDAYFKQIKIVLKEFSDKNNLEFRRKVLHPEYKYKKLTTVTEEELKCSKTKEEEAEKIRQLIRENQKIDAKETIQIDDQQLLECPKLTMFNSISDIYNEQKEVYADYQKKENQKMLQKTKQICKKVYVKIVKSGKNMSERVAKIRSGALNNFMLNAIEQIN